MTAVIFDCDGVLVDSEVLALEIELTSLKEIGLEFDLEVYQKRHLGTTSTEFFREIEADYHAKFDAPSLDMIPTLPFSLILTSLTVRASTLTVSIIFIFDGSEISQK